MFRTLGRYREDFFFKRDSEDFLVKELEGGEGLILGGGSDTFINCQVGQIGFNLDLTHFAGVAFIMEEDKAFYPGGIGFFSGVGIIKALNGCSNLI
jgi:hypothetical protein